MTSTEVPTRTEDAEARGTPGPGASSAPPGRRRAGPSVRDHRHRRSVGPTCFARLFLLPALVLLGALVVYPIGYSVVRSLYGAAAPVSSGSTTTGRSFTDDARCTAVENTAIWVVVAPTLVTALGLIFAVLTERVRWGTAFKLIVFMPMAISMLAAGIIFRLVYEQDPDQGVANAVVTSGPRHVRDLPALSRRPRPRTRHAPRGERRRLRTTATCAPGDVVPLGSWASGPRHVPSKLGPAPPNRRRRRPTAITGTVWLDFTRGGGGERARSTRARRRCPA